MLDDNYEFNIVPDIKSLLFLIAFDLMVETKIIESNEAAIKLQNNIYILHKLINNGYIYLECSSSVIMSFIRYLEIQNSRHLIKDEHLRGYIDKLFDIVKFKNDNYDILLSKTHVLKLQLMGN
ncbi:MAG: hypothetical protein AB4057_00015 [Crocosphaera sp.]